MRSRRRSLLCASGLLCLQFATAGAVRAAESVAPTAERAPDTFFIQAIDVTGVTKLPTGEVERLIYPFAGPGKTQNDVEAARKALQDAYAAKGYGAVVVEVPVQKRETFSQGIIQIAVAEAPIGQIHVTDSRYHSLWVARGQVPSLVEGAPVNLTQLQSEITAANRFPDRVIDPVFKPGKVPGTIDVDLKVTDQRPYHASVHMDNDFSPNTTPLRLSTTLRYTNLFQTGQSFTFTYVVAPMNRDDTEVFAGSYVIPLLHSPWSFAISGYRSNSNVSSLGGSSVLGKGYQVGLRAIYALPSKNSSQTISFGPDFKDFQQKILVGDATASSAPVRYIPIEAQYARSGATEHSTYSLSLGTTIGVRAIKQIVCVDVSGVCSPESAFRNREQYSNENFVRGNFSFDYSYAFNNDVIAAFRLTGQLADSHLITNEQFSAGGLQSVRGYYAAEAVGDNGISPSLELRSPSFASHFGKWLTEARLYGFADAAFIKVLNPLPDTKSSFAPIGVGGGLKFRLFNKISGEVLGAVPLSDGTSSKSGEPRVNFELKGEF